MTRKIKNLLLAALFAVSPFAPIAQALESPIGSVTVLPISNVRMTSTDVDFGVIDQGAILGKARNVTLDCTTDKGTIGYAGDPPDGANQLLESVDAQCGEISVDVVASSESALTYTIKVGVTTDPNTTSGNTGQKTVDADLSIYGPASYGVATDFGRSLFIAHDSNGGQISLTVPADTSDSILYKLGGILYVAASQVSGAYEGEYTVSVTVQ